MKTRLMAMLSLWLLIGFPYNAGPAVSTGGRSQAVPFDVPLDRAIIINEIMPNPSSGAEWVELYNTGRPTNVVFLPLVLKNQGAAVTEVSGAFRVLQATGSQGISLEGWQLGNEEGIWYTIPAALPPVPFGAYVLVYFDGAGPGADDYDFGDNVAVLHSPTGMTGMFGNDQGQTALYTGSSHYPDTVRAYTAWGNMPGLKATTASKAGLWREIWYVRAEANGGDETFAATDDLSFGVVPDGTAAHVANWSAYGPGDSTAGAPNGVPRPRWSSTDEGTIMDAQEFAVGWESIPGAAQYQFQMDNSANFTSPEVDLLTSEPAYVPASNPLTQRITQSLDDPATVSPTSLPPGLYHWRARAADVSGRWGPWSLVRTLTLASPTLSAGGEGPAAPEACAEVTLGVPWKLQHSDTAMLDLDGSPETRQYAWDAPNQLGGVPVRGDPLGDNYCVRASVSMINAYYGGALSQDRISYHVLEEWAGNFRLGTHDGQPEGDLGYDRGMFYPDEEDEAISWALGTPITAIGGKPAFSQFKAWLNAGRAVMIRRPPPPGGHMMVLEGYRECADGSEWLHINDPWNAPRWQDYATQRIDGVWLGPAGPGGAPDVRSDEEDIWLDWDGDGVVNFDENVRFSTSEIDADSDNDLVLDRADIREYVFDWYGNYHKRDADWDGDGWRKERDADNDDDGTMDGCEDTNRNGRHEPLLGESDNFDAASEIDCTTPLLFVNWAEMDFDTYIQQRNFQIRNNGGGTLDWEIDTGSFPTWLSISDDSGSLGAGEETTIYADVDCRGLDVGQRTYSFDVTSNGGSASVLVLMEVAATVDLGTPDYDSGWTAIAQNTAHTFDHDLGGNVDDYLVRLDYRAPDINGINARHLGGIDFSSRPPAGYNPNDRVGAYWYSLTANRITVYRRPEDGFAPEVRVRIWRAPVADYDSGWQPMGQDHARHLVHGLRGRGQDYLVDLEFSGSDFSGINARYLGGADFGSNPPGGMDPNDRVGAYWRSLDGRNVWVYRRPEDDYARQVRLRMWHMEPAAYDSDWQAIDQFEDRSLTHNLAGNVDDYLVDLICRGGSFTGINARYLGGADFGAWPPAGHVEGNRVGVYWRSLTATNIGVYRRPEDTYAQEVLIRIWQP